MGFFADGSEQVDARYERLVAAGVSVPRGPRTMRGRYGFYFNALGVMFEVPSAAE